MSVLHWMSSKALELFTVCRSIIFDVSNPSYCMAFLFLLFLVSFKKSSDAMAGTCRSGDNDESYSFWSTWVSSGDEQRLPKYLKIIM